MHVEAMINNDANGKRFLLSSQTMWYSKVSEILRDNGFKKAPRFSAPNFIIRLFAKFDREVRLILDRLGVKYQLSSNNAKNILKWKPRNIETSIVKTAKQLYDLRKI